VDLPAAFAKDPIYTFNEDSPDIKLSFPIENRTDIGESQVTTSVCFLKFIIIRCAFYLNSKDFNALNNYLKQFKNYRFLTAMSDFHLLIFLITNQTIHFDVSL
jgi:nuclear protein localization family protein 4